MDNKKRFERICKDIRAVNIQGARNVALAGLEAYHLFPTEKNKQKIISLRPTEPFLINVLKTPSISIKELILKIDRNQEVINKETFKILHEGDVVFTHCHSSTIVKALVYAKRKGKNFEVYLTETRPLYQGRKTAKELKKAGIKVTMFVDSAGAIALTSEQGTKKADLVLLGADAITKKGTINKVGSGMFAQIAKYNKIPVYILADSMKYVKRIKLEKRPSKEVWSTKKIRVANFAFELIKKKYIKGVISEYGLLPYRKFLKANKKLPLS